MTENCGRGARVRRVPFLSGLESRESEAGSDFFALGPVVIGVAFRAAGFRVARAGGVAGLAGGEAGDEDVGRFGAAQGFLVAASTGKTAMGIVIEFGVGEPAVDALCCGDLGKR